MMCICTSFYLLWLEVRLVHWWIKCSDVWYGLKMFHYILSILVRIWPGPDVIGLVKQASCIGLLYVESNRLFVRCSAMMCLACMMIYEIIGFILYLHSFVEEVVI